MTTAPVNTFSQTAGNATVSASDQTPVTPPAVKGKELSIQAKQTAWKVAGVLLLLIGAALFPGGFAGAVYLAKIGCDAGYVGLLLTAFFGPAIIIPIGLEVWAKGFPEAVTQVK